jgi:MHS family alpha-ketoglutarate permease-like MFS transporter
LIGALLAVVVFWIRQGLEESIAFKRPAQREALSRGQVVSAGVFLALTVIAGVLGVTTGPLARPGQIAGAVFLVLFFISLIVPLVRRHPRESLLIMGLTAGGSLTFYVYTTYMQKFLVNTAGFSKGQASEVSALSLIGFMLMQPLAGWLSDKVGRKPMLIIAFGGGALTIWPIMTGISHATSVATALWLILAGVALQSCYTSISAVVKAEMFPAEIRALGVALPYALANVLFGGTAEMVALAFKHEKLESTFYVYVAGVMTLGLICSIVLKDTGRNSLIHED